MIDNINYNQLPPDIVREGAWFSKKDILYCGIIFFLSMFLIYQLFIKTPDSDYKDKEDKIGKIELVIDSIQKSNVLLKDKIIELEEKDRIIDNKIIQKQNQIDQLKKDTNEKINAVDNFDNIQLERFFTDRYRNQK